MEYQFNGIDTLATWCFNFKLFEVFLKSFGEISLRVKQTPSWEQNTLKGDNERAMERQSTFEWSV